MNKVKGLKAVMMTMALVALMSVSAFAADTVLDLSTIQFDSIFNEISAIIPYVLPVVISFIALRKGIGFLKSMLKGA